MVWLERYDYIGPLISCLKGYCSTQGHLDFSPVLSSRSFIVLLLHLCLYPFWVNFYEGWISKLLRHHLLKDSFLCCIAITASLMISWLYLCVFFWALHSILLIYLSVFSPVTYCLDYYSFMIIPEVVLVLQLCSSSLLS